MVGIFSTSRNYSVVFVLWTTGQAPILLELRVVPRQLPLVMKLWPHPVIKVMITYTQPRLYGNGLGVENKVGF